MNSVSKIKHLILSLKILKRCLKILQSTKKASHEKDRIPLLEGVRSKFLLESLSLKSETFDSW